ncbi:MAG: outer membrane protein assembly factor [Nitrospirae bacterium]|jgi:translocation and assembly module TamA|nr:outer membrane protein assembly factor [Nitrospirota bacterium]
MLFFIRIACILIVLLISAFHLFAEGTAEVVIHGLEGELLENVKSALTIPAGMVKDGKLNMLWLAHFKENADEKARKALEPFGYYSPDIEVKIDKTAEMYSIVVVVDPGQPVRIAEVNIDIRGPGSKEKALTDFVLHFPINKGDILNHAKYEETKGIIKAEAEELGYIDADFAVHKILISKKEFSAIIELTLDTGHRWRFGEIRFRGAPEYKKTFLKRYLAFRKGEVFSHNKLADTQLNLMNSERFSSVLIIPEKEKSEEFHVPIIIELKPAPPKRFKAGIGYGTDTGARLSTQYSDLNVFGRGHEFTSMINLSERRQGLGLGYIIPGSKDIDNITAFRLNLQREDIDVFENRLLSLEASRTKSFGKGRLGTAYTKIQYEESTIAPQDITSFTVLPGVRFSQKRYDDIIRPKQGFRYIIDLRGTSKYIGSAMNLLQVLAEGNMLYPLPWQMSLFTGIKTAVSIQDEPLSELPASLRFFAGGDRSVRGYKYQSLGPKDKKGDLTGGKNLLVGSVEIERPVYDNLGIAIFYDAGNAFNSFSDITLFQGAGLGIRYYSAVGMLRLDLARQIDVDDPKFRIHFTVGLEL